MDDEEVRAILAKVQAGEMSPEDAVLALGAGRSADDDAGPDFDALPESPPGTDFSGVRVVQLRATANRTKVIADPTVHTVKVSGPHHLRLEGDRLIVENEIGDEPFGRGSKVTVGADGERHIRISGMRGARISFRSHEQLEVRVNPSMPLDFDCDAGTIEILGVIAAITGRVNAGSAVIEDFAGPLQLSVNAGKLRASGRLDGGDSSIDVNVGKADVMLEHGSNVRIIRSATLGTAEADHDTVGTGAGTLRVTCSLGSIRVHSSEGSLSIKHSAN